MSYKVQKPCRICGKMYTPCPDCEGDKSAFHWRTVACSRECAVEYFKRIEISRNINSKAEVKNNEIKAIQKNSSRKAKLGQNKEQREQIG